MLFNPGSGPANKWRDSVAESQLHNGQQESHEEKNGSQTNNGGPGLGKFNERWSLEEVFGNDTDSDSLDCDMTVPMEEA
jgi:hypothetical protein